MTTFIMRAAFVTLFALAATPAWAEGGHISVTMAVEKEIQVIDEDGNPVTQRQPAKLVLPGDEVIYTINYVNTSEEVATNVVLTNPIPEHVTYTPNSAEGVGTEISFSVDGGAHYGSPDDLVVIDADGESRPAEVADYSHIRWLVSTPLNPSDARTASYRARLN